jgi:hypothetical protein
MRFWGTDAKVNVVLVLGAVVAKVTTGKVIKVICLVARRILAAGFDIVTVVALGTFKTVVPAGIAPWDSSATTNVPGITHCGTAAKVRIALPTAVFALKGADGKG